MTSFSFKEYLVEIEQNISFDPEAETPEELAKRVRQAHRVAGNSPGRTLRDRQKAIKAKSADLKVNKDDPLAQDRLAIKNMEERIVKMKMLLARKEQQMGAGV